MGIESDKLVFDYLSRVGDLAHGTSMTAAERARLVAGLRSEIDRRRAEAGGAESKAAVRKILKRLGTPDEVVAGANRAQGGSGTDARAERRESVARTYGEGGDAGGEPGGGDRSGDGDGDGRDRGGARDPHAGSRFRRAADSSGEPSGTAYGTAGTSPGTASGTSAVPGQRDGSAGKTSLWKRAAAQGRSAFGSRDADGDTDTGSGTDPAGNGGSGSGPVIEPTAVTRPTAAFGPSSPHLAGMDELGPLESDPDWWRRDLGRYGGMGGDMLGEALPGFVGGIELPEVLKPPPVQAGQGGRTGQGGQGGQPGQGGADGAGAAVPNPRTEADGAEPGGAKSGPRWRRLLGGGGQRRGGAVELVAAVLLLAGAALGTLIPLAVGWLAAWWSPRLSRTEAKWAAFGMPGLVAGGTAVWIWGRANGRWGPPLSKSNEAVQAIVADSWPVLLRIAAVATALFLIWRARRST